MLRIELEEAKFLAAISDAYLSIGLSNGYSRDELEGLDTIVDNGEKPTVDNQPGTVYIGTKSYVEHLEHEYSFYKSSSSPDNSDYSTLYGYGLKENINGVSGMNIEKVKDGLETFSSYYATTIVEDFNDLKALDISMFDPNGSIKSAFTTKINQLSTEIDNSVKQIESSIKEAIETEAELVTGASQQAAEAFNNINSQG